MPWLDGSIELLLGNFGAILIADDLDTSHAAKMVRPFSTETTITYITLL